MDVTLLKAAVHRYVHYFLTQSGPSCIDQPISRNILLSLRKEQRNFLNVFLLVVMTTVTMVERTRAKDTGDGPKTSGRNRGETQKMRKKAGRERKNYEKQIEKA